MKKFKHLLVGVDFSPVCASALKTASRLAAAHEAKLTVVHVVDPWFAEEFMRTYNFSEAQLIADVKRKVESFIEQSTLGEKPDAIYVKTAHPVVALTELGKELEADLLVMGTRGNEHGPNQMGAIASMSVRKVPMNVLLVRNAHEGPFKKITACVDFSDTSRKALRFAASMAQCDGAALSVLHVCQSPMMLSLNYSGFLPEVPITERVVANESRQRLDHFVTEALGKQSAELIPNNVVVEHVSVREAIVNYLTLGSFADLLVLGSHGTSNIKEFLIGTAAETMVKQASCSVLVVKPKRPQES